MKNSPHPLQTSPSEVDVNLKQGQPRARAQEEIGPALCAVTTANASQLQEPVRAVSVAEAASLMIQALATAPNLIPDTVTTLQECLHASQEYYNKNTKEWSPSPDYRTRLATVQLILTNLVGLPLQRIESKSMSVQATAPDATRAMMRSPAMRAALRRMLDEAEDADKK